MDATASGASIARAVAARHHEISVRVRGVDADVLRAGSLLPGWDRLTILCHLRYGALASHRLTEAALSGRAAAFYPGGRRQQRPGTLCPDEGESDREVLASFDANSRRLDRAWESLTERQWRIVVDEPPDNQDLGPVTLRTVALLRLTEVEVHGHDLDLGLSPWSETFVSAALPMRLHRLPARRSNHRDADETIDATWLLASTDGPAFLVRARGAEVEVHETDTGTDAADATITGTARQLLAFILGRQPLDGLDIGGDTAVAHRFLTAFPAP